MADRKEQSERREVSLERALRVALPQLAGLLLREDQGFLELRIKQRAYAEVVVVVKREDAAGGTEVLFGVGYDVLGALLGADGAMAGNRWREDRPWTPTQ